MNNNELFYKRGEIPPKSELFSINTNYNSSEINKVMKSSTNIFTHLSPLLTETLTSFNKPKIPRNFNTISVSNMKKKIFKRNKNSKNKIIYVKTHSNFHNKGKKFILGPENPPSINDKDKLTSFYKISDDKIITNKFKSPEEKLFRDKLFEKYNIKKINNNITNEIPNQNSTHNNFFPHLNDNNNTHLKIAIRYFKNMNKASKVLNINRQLVKRINEMSNFFLLQKYSQKIEKNQEKKFFENKMPKIQIRVQTKKKSNNFNFELNNNNYEERETKQSKKSKNRNMLFQNKKLNSLGSIKLPVFRKFAYNGLIEPELIEDIPEVIVSKQITDFNKEEDNKKKEIEKMKKMNKIERHYLSLNISEIFNAFKPSSRMEFSLTKFGNKIYLYGGLSSIIYNDLWTYNIDRNKWNKVALNSKDIALPRKGHTSLIIKNTLFIYGGETPKDSIPEDIVAYNLIMDKFFIPKVNGKRKINQRKGHIMVGTNQTFLVQGGVDVRTLNIENSAFIYNIYENYWESLEYIGKPLPYRAYHSAVIVNRYSRNSLGVYTFYSLPDDLSEENKSKIRYEGIYMFGGINEKKNYTNTLFIIKTGKKPCINIKPKIQGRPPEPRIHAKMLFLENYDFLVIHGGIKINQNYCDNIAVLNLENFNWIKPIIDDEKGEPNLIGRIKHEIFFSEDKLYILGGLGEENMLPMNFEIVEFEVTGFFDNLMLDE